jgi:hypothetical protein
MDDIFRGKNSSPGAQAMLQNFFSDPAHMDADIVKERDARDF